MKVYIGEKFTTNLIKTITHVMGIEIDFNITRVYYVDDSLGTLKNEHIDNREYFITIVSDTK